MSFDDLKKLTGDVVTSEKILSLLGDISDYSHFRTLVDLGFTISPSEYDFDKIMVFSWIKEGIDRGRKD